MSRIGVCLARRGRSHVIVSLLLVGLSLGVLSLLTRGSSAELNGPGARDHHVARSVSKLLERIHLARRPLDDEMAGRALESYLKSLDPMKLHFLQSDVDKFMEQRTEIDDQLLRGDIQLGYTIFEQFLKRIDQRNAILDELLKQDPDFTIDEEMVTDGDALQYPRDEAELRERWRKRLKFDILIQKADDLTLEEAKEKLARRYQSYAKRMRQTDNDELLEMYLSAMTTGYDPHTTYMSASTLENFEIMMRLELDGIGASLQFDDGYTVVHKIIPGGAADKHGKLKPKDQIVSVGQDADGEMLDVVDMKLSEVVKMIRGKRDTVVRLGVLPGGEGPIKIYNITRARIELKDSEARYEIFNEGQEADGTAFLVGVIDLPSFYMDMNGARLGKPDFKSTTRDVRNILDTFKEKGVDSVVLDLRKNGGGSLTEAVNLTGLFIETGPVVQVKGFDGNVEPYEDRNPEMAWDGPLVVLISQFSASASEIFAGAIQDYHRGIVVGDKATHGKGTVQQLLDLGNQIFRGLPNAPKLGALKVTIQQFYRPSGDSTQNRGVVSDIELPSLTTHLDVGESDLDYALGFDRVDPVPFKNYNQVDVNLIGVLKGRSLRRLNESEKFIEVLKNIERYVAQKERKAVSLNEEKFLADREKLDAEKQLEEEQNKAEDPDAPVIDRDYYFEEALAITRDYVDLLHKNKIAGK